MQGWELDSRILLGPFQCRIFCDSAINQQGLCCSLHLHHNFSNFIFFCGSCLFLGFFHPATSVSALVWHVFLNFLFMLEPAPFGGNSPSSPCLLALGVPQVQASQPKLNLWAGSRHWWQGDFLETVHQLMPPAMHEADSTDSVVPYCTAL